jgi:hypothetical protein
MHEMFVVRWKNEENGSTFRSEFFKADDAIEFYNKKLSESLPFVEIKKEKIL